MCIHVSVNREFSRNMRPPFEIRSVKRNEKIDLQHFDFTCDRATARTTGLASSAPMTSSISHRSSFGCIGISKVSQLPNERLKPLHLYVLTSGLG